MLDSKFSKYLVSTVPGVQSLLEQPAVSLAMFSKMPIRASTAGATVIARCDGTIAPRMDKNWAQLQVYNKLASKERNQSLTDHVTDAVTEANKYAVHKEVQIDYAVLVRSQTQSVLVERATKSGSIGNTLLFLHAPSAHKSTVNIRALNIYELMYCYMNLNNIYKIY
eukprot:SAG31_NODE_6982_length_1826_cov_35.563405_1_plen_167_part_00